jgi:hypothetical protein
MSGNEQRPQGGGFFSDMREGLQAWGAGGEASPAAKAPVPITWLGPDGPIEHDFTDHVLEATMHSGGRIPNTVGLSRRDRGVILGAAGVLGVAAPEVSRRLGGRQARREAGLTGEQSGDKRRTQIWLPSPDDVATSLEMGETAGGLIVAAHILERHRPAPLRVIRPVRDLGVRAVGGLAHIRDPYQNQYRLREVVDDIIGRAYGRGQRRGRGLKGDDEAAHSIQSPLLWARAVELSGQRHCADGQFLGRVQRGFEKSFIDHRQFREGYPSEIKQMQDDILGARLAAQFEHYDLLHTINSLMRKEDLGLVEAAQRAGVRLTRENHEAVLSWLDTNLKQMRQFIGLMKKDGMIAEEASARLRRQLRPISPEVRVRLASDHADRMEGRRQEEREARVRAAAEKIAESERRQRRRELTRESAEDYGYAVLANPSQLAQEARTALSNGDTDEMTTYAMALFEQTQVGINRATEEMKRLWPEVAAPAIEAVHVKIDDITNGVASLGELLLIDNLEPSTIRNPDLKAKASALKRALNEAAFNHYGYNTINSPVDPGERMVNEDGEIENVKPTPYGGVSAPGDAEAIRAGFIYTRRTAAGAPVVYEPQQLDLLALLEERWAGQLLRAAENADRRILPRQLQADIAQIEAWAARMRKGQKMERVKDFWHMVKEDVIKKGLTEYDNPLRKKWG